MKAKVSHHIIELEEARDIVVRSIPESYNYAIHISNGACWEGFYWVKASAPSEALDRWVDHGLKMTKQEIKELFNR